MKRFWLVLLSLGLIAAFSTSAMAVDVQFSGSLYVAGVYLDKVGLTKDPGSADRSFSTAFFYQRLRVQTDFVAAPGVKVITRFDALERVWNGPRTSPGTDWDGTPAVGNQMSAGTLAENQNIAFDWAYIQFMSPIGRIEAGYMQDGPWATVFGDTSYANPRITWLLPLLSGKLNLFATAVKLQDNSYTAYNAAMAASDRDSDKYAFAFWWADKWGMAGLLAAYFRNAATRSSTEATSYLASYYLLAPFVIVNVGPVKVQAEIDYVFGKARVYDSTLSSDVKIDNLIGWIDALVTIGPVYGGLTFAYVAGDDPLTTDKLEGLLTGGRDWDPCLIMFNYNDRGKWIGPIYGNANTQDIGQGVRNAWFYQGKIGVKPTPKIDVYATLTYASADKKEATGAYYTPAGVLSAYAGSAGSSYGWELDVVGTYKITNNLSYMLGGGYWFVGDYYKGTATTTATKDDFMIINKLTLTF